MRRYFFKTDVVKASGYQRWYVDAESFEEAKRLEDHAEFDDEEVEVTSLGTAEWESSEGEEIPEADR